MKFNLLVISLLVTVTSFCSQSLKDRALLKLTKQGYILKENNTKTRIPSYDIHQELRKMTPQQLKLYQAKHSIIMKRMSDGSCQFEPGHGLKGGGLLGAKIGFWVGKVTVHVGARIGFLIAAACTGPAAPAVYAGLEASCLIPLEAASNVVGLACGIAGGVMTGPV